MTDRPEERSAETPPEEPLESEQRRFPTAFTVLVIVLLGVWALSFLIPSSSGLATVAESS